jgi:diguanylate cyclase (GGDEF)-like protein/PAS domain S-box-containing protein
MRPTLSRARRDALLITLVTLGYVAVFATVAGVFGPLLHALASIPVLVAAWVRGRRAALYTLAVVMVPPLATLLYRHDFTAASLGAQALSGAVLLAMGLGLGTLRERTERELRTQRALEARYERAASGASDVLWEWELETGQAFFSAQWADLLGEAEHDLAPRIDEWLDRVHAEDLPDLRREIELHRSGESVRFEHEHRLRRKDGTTIWVRVRGIASSARDTAPQRITGWITDITDQKRSEAQLRRLAFHDALTGLPNRALFMDRLRKAAERHKRDRLCFAVLLMDLDRFKVVNDSLGHAVGDHLLVKAGRLLRDVLRPTDTIARMGGDEFVILLEDLQRPEDAEQRAAELLEVLARPIELDGHRVVTGASIGLAGSGLDREVSAEDLVREADIAMYQAKALGGSRVGLYDPASHHDFSERLDLENELRRALDGQTLHVHYQPIVDVLTGVVVGFEALARWQHPRLGPVSPAKFIPIAEEAGLIEQLGECVLRMACREAQKLRTAFPDAPPWRMGVNLSVAQLTRVDLCSRIEAALAESGLSADFLSLEITESGLLEDTETASRTFAQLRAQGVRLAMDDFGTGYSSLQYLRRFRVDTLKIDGSFVRGIFSPSGEEICAAVISLGRDLGLSVIAEGVERPEELARLKQLGGRYAQGFLLSRPLAPEQLAEWLMAMPGWRLALAG